MDGAKTADSAVHQCFGRRFHPVAEQYAFRAAKLRAADGSGLDFVDDEIVDMGKAGLHDAAEPSALFGNHVDRCLVAFRL